MSHDDPTPKELRESIQSSRMQPDKARDVLLKLRGHIDGMLEANGDAKKIVWHYKRLRGILQGPWRSLGDLPRLALISSYEKDWFMPLVEEMRREHEKRLAEQRKGRAQCPKCLLVNGVYTPWLLPDEECGCADREREAARPRGKRAARSANG